MIGASGAVGTNAVQVARALGATVTGVTSGPNADVVRSLGAVHVVDRTTTRLGDLDERYDVVVDTVGEMDLATGRTLLADGGRLLLVAADLPTMLRARGPVKAGPARERTQDVRTLLAWLADGTVVNVTDSTFALEDVAAAHARVDTGRKVGNVLLRMPAGAA